jgi:enoyl-CoA hydratase
MLVNSWSTAMPSTRTDTHFERIDGGLVATVSIRGEKTLNVVDRVCLQALAEDLAELGACPDLRCLVLQGHNARAFVGGANLAALHGLTPTSAEEFIRAVHDLCAVLRAAPVPVIAVLRGYCLGAGLEIAAACDVRVGDRSVVCGMPEVRVGVPSVVEAALLPGLIGWGKARELMLRGHLIDANEAQAVGFLQHLVDAVELEGLARTIAADVVASAPGAIAAQKRLFLAWEEQGISGAIESGVRAFVEAYASDEPQRSIEAFYTRRGKPPP